MIKIAPSILSADFTRLGEHIKETEAAGAEYLHIDVMDGIFVPNISFGKMIPQCLRKLSSQVFDVHLMITDPLRYIDDFISAGADIITIHHEACFNQIETLKYIKEKGIKAAISIRPYTDPCVLEQYIPYVDMILIMSVNPGFGGQSFIPHAIDNVKAARDIIKNHGADIEIEVDGGLSADNVHLVTSAGASVIVAGSSIFGKNDINAAVAQLREAAEKSFVW